MPINIRPEPLSIATICIFGCCLVGYLAILADADPLVLAAGIITIGFSFWNLFILPATWGTRERGQNLHAHAKTPTGHSNNTTSHGTRIASGNAAGSASQDITCVSQLLFHGKVMSHHPLACNYPTGRRGS